MVWNYITQPGQVLRLLNSRIGKTAVIYPASLLAGIAGSMVVLGMVFFAHDVLGATPTQIGCLGATWPFCYTLGCLGLRPIAVRMHPRYSVLLATSMLALNVYAIYFLRSLVWTFVFYAGFGFSIAFFWPPIMGWLSTDAEGLRLSRAMGWFNLAWSSGAILGQGLAGWLSDLGPGLSLCCAATIYLSTAFLLLGAVLTLSGLKQEEGSALCETSPEPDQRDGSFLRYPGWVGAFAVFAAMGAIVTVFPLSAQNDLRFSRSMIGLFLLSRMLANSVSLGLMGRFDFWHFKAPQMILGSVATSLFCICLMWAHGPASIAAAMFGLGVVTAHAYTNSVFHGAAAAAHRSWRMAVHECVVNAGVIAGSIMGGLAYGNSGAVAAYSLCAGATALGALVQYLLVRRHSRRPRGAPPPRP